MPGIFVVPLGPNVGMQDPPIAHSHITCARLTTVYIIQIIGESHISEQVKKLLPEQVPSCQSF